MNLMVVLLIMSVVCGIAGCALFASGKKIGICLVVVSGLIAGASLGAIRSVSYDKSASMENSLLIEEDEK